MANTVNSPNMSMPVPVVSQAPGPDWAEYYDACLGIVDQHNHTPGSGVPISQDGIGLTPGVTTFDSLNFNGSNAYALRSVRYINLSGAISLGTDIGCTYESGGEFWYNDANGNQVQITAGGAVNATSSGISSGTATASFVASVLVVNRAAATPANIQCASILLGNNVASSSYLTLQPPNAMASSYSLTLPSVPGVTSIMALDTSGNMSGAYTVDSSTIVITANVIGVAAAGIGTTQLAAASVTSAKLASNLNLPGNAVQENGKNLVVSNTNASASIAIVRIRVTNSGFVSTVVSGEGATVSASATNAGVTDVTWSVAFADTPTVLVSVEGIGNSPLAGLATAQVVAPTTTGCTVVTFNSSFANTAGTFALVAYGKRA